jgi:abortive infection bacteriophage resistance protein
MWRVFYCPAPGGEAGVKYNKPALSFEQQADQLLSRGFQADRARLIETLRRVSYYRLTAYWHPFKRPDDTFAPGTTLDKIWRRYTFDRQLRLLVMDAIERVEVAVLRTLMVEQHVRKYGPFGYRAARNFRPEFAGADHRRMMDELDDAMKRSREPFVNYFRTKYFSEPGLPLWMAAELASFGTLFTFYRSLHLPEQKQLAGQLGLPANVLQSWLFCLNYIRNLCAHHSRLWNRELSIRPLVPDLKNNPEWHHPAAPDNRRTFAVLTLLRWLLLKIAPQSRWPDRLQELLNNYSDIPLNLAGFPAGWETSPVWNQKAK